MTSRRQALIALTAVAVVWGHPGTAGTATLTDAQVCEAAKLKAAGKKEQCLADERAEEVKGKIPDYEKCTADFARAFEKAEFKAGPGICPSDGDAPAVEAVIDGCFETLKAVLAGGSIPTCPAFPATGQTTCYSTAGGVIPCAATLQDGDVKAGAALSYTDNGDGTVTDNNTGLMWEKKSLEGTIATNINHRDKGYTWADALAAHIAALNAGGGFAGHTDWRLPNVKELQSIVNYENVIPAVSPAFNTACAASCTVLTCSCTQLSGYWSSTTNAGIPENAWLVNFGLGDVGAADKDSTAFVRAVRGGL